MIALRVVGPRILLGVATICAFVSAAPLGAQAEWRIRTESSIGDALGAEALTRITDLTVDDIGNIYVAQPVDHRVRVLSAGDSETASIGREGRGPGEFVSPEHVDFVDGRLFVLDGRTWRLSSFDASGDFEDNWNPIPFADGALLVHGSTGLATGSILYAGLPRRDDAELTRLFVGGGEGKPRPVAAIHWGDQTRSTPMPRGHASIRQPISHQTLWDVAPDGKRIVIVDRPAARDARATFVVNALALNGDTIWSRTFVVPAVAIDEAAADHAVERIVRGMIDRMGDLPLPRNRIHAALKRGIVVPYHQATIDRMFVGRDGRIWLRRGAFALETAQWLILNANGRREARLEVPADIELFEADGAVAWGSSITEDLGVPVVHRFQIMTNDPG